MCLSRFLFLSIFLTSSTSGAAAAACIGFCAGSATASAGVIVACPEGDGDTLESKGLGITVTINQCPGIPLPGVPASDIWVIGCNGTLTMCSGRGLTTTGPTDENGQTTITGVLPAGGCDFGGLLVVVRGSILGTVECARTCVPIKVKSPDINGDLVVNLADFSIFGGASGYPSPPKPYNECIDYTAPFGTVTLPDYAKYGSHSGHRC